MILIDDPGPSRFPALDRQPALRELAQAGAVISETARAS